MAVLVRVVSGGQTGVDRAALDAAMEMGIEIGGWCPRGRRAEDGIIDDRYPLEETPSQDYPERTEWNARDSDGTLILAAGEPTGGTAFTIVMADRHRRPYLVVDIAGEPDTKGAVDWIFDQRIQVLNVAGPRESTYSGAYEKAHLFVRRLLQALARPMP